MNIVHVIRGLANSSGTTHIVGPLAEAQARLGHKVRVLYVDKAGEPAVEPDPRLVVSQRFPMTVPSRHYGWSRSFTRGVRASLKNADVLHVHAIWNYPTWCAMREAKRIEVPYIVAPQGSLEPWALNRTRRAKHLYAAVFEKRLFDHAAAMQALTDAEAVQCERYAIKAPVQILPNGVDLDTIDACNDVADLRADLNLPKSSFLFLFLGRLFPKKGLDLLLSAFEAVTSQVEDARLLIAGHDAGTGYRHELEAKIAELGIHNRVYFLGELRGPKKFAVLRGVDAFVLTSHSEGLPVAVLEAMACSKPVVVTPGCHLPEVPSHEAGWEVQADEKSVCSGLLQAMSDQAATRQRGVNARQLIQSQFTWPVIAAKSVQLYKSFLPAIQSP